MQYGNFSIPEYHTNEEFVQAEVRGERFLYKNFVNGFGVKLHARGLHVPGDPVTLDEAEKIQQMVAGQFPEAVIVRMGMDTDYVPETMEAKPGDYFNVSFISEVQPGKWGTATDLLRKDYDEALQRIDELKAQGYLGVQLIRLRADEPMEVLQ